MARKTRKQAEKAVSKLISGKERRDAAARIHDETGQFGDKAMREKMESKYMEEPIKKGKYRYDQTPSKNAKRK